MKKYWKPIITLMLLTALLPEVLSGSTSILIMAQPVVFLLFLTIGYGFPVLILRELMVRKNLNLVSMFMLGIGYGIYNEGLFARTIFNPYHSPVDSFAIYGLVGDVRIPWVLSIGTWHALYAVVFSIVLAHYLFPSVSRDSWISARTAWILSLLGLAAGTAAFLNVGAFGQKGNIMHLVFMFVSFAVLWLVAYYMPRRPFISSEVPDKFSWRTPMFGSLLLVVFYIVPSVLAAVAIPSLFFVAYYAVIILIGAYRLLKFQTISVSAVLQAALGGEIALCLFGGFIALIQMRLEVIATNAFLLIIFAFVLFKERSKSRALATSAA